MNEQPHKIKTCPHCKTAFTCIQTTGCWCEKITTTPEQLKILEQTYANCLCKECLSAFSSGRLFPDQAVEEIKNQGI